MGIGYTVYRLPFTRYCLGIPAFCATCAHLAVSALMKAAYSSVSAPLTWDEVKKGVTIADFRLDNVRARFAKLGDLWKPLLQQRGRTNLEKFM